MNDANDKWFATRHATDVDAALAQLTVVIPVGPGDALAPELRLQLCGKNVVKLLQKCTRDSMLINVEKLV